ncbi:hypothetical protein IFR05_008589 [Cadophora sp. M221]|nr:hypothetical protein IFR05_008589 [Cadophora sp. M221]
MAGQRDSQDPKDTLYLYLNCDHEWIGPFEDRPAPWQTMPGNSLDTRYILGPPLCPACNLGATSEQDKPWIHWGCKHVWIPGNHPGLQPAAAGALPADLRVQDLSSDPANPDVNVLHPRFCHSCLLGRQARLRALRDWEVCEQGPYTQGEELAYVRGCRDGRVLAEGSDFRWGWNKAFLNVLLSDPDPYDGVSDGTATNLGADALMNALANSLTQVDLSGQFNPVDQLADAFSRTNIDNPQNLASRQLHWKGYGKRDGDVVDDID